MAIDQKVNHRSRPLSINTAFMIPFAFPDGPFTDKRPLSVYILVKSDSSFKIHQLPPGCIFLFCSSGHFKSGFPLKYSISKGDRTGYMTSCSKHTSPSKCEMNKNFELRTSHILPKIFEVPKSKFTLDSGINPGRSHGVVLERYTN